MAYQKRFSLSKGRIIIIVLGLLGMIGLALHGQWINPQDRANSGKSGESAKPDSKTAWNKLQQSAQSRLNSPDIQAATVREIMGELQGFAETYAGTEEAVLATYNHGLLGAGLGDYETADKSLRQALKQNKDPQLAAAIRVQLGQLSIRPGSTPPGFTAPALDGRKVSPSDYKGKVLLLDFWATWCGPCIVELPNVKTIYSTYHDQGFEIVSISLDRSKEALQQFIKKENLSWTHIYNPDLPRGQDIATQYGITGIPQMILVGRNGRIADIGMRGQLLERAVKRAVNADSD